MYVEPYVTRMEEPARGGVRGWYDTSVRKNLGPAVAHLLFLVIHHLLALAIV